MSTVDKIFSDLYWEAMGTPKPIREILYPRVIWDGTRDGRINVSRGPEESTKEK